jgi:SAM-dependent methyltransferase
VSASLPRPLGDATSALVAIAHRLDLSPGRLHEERPRLEHAVGVIVEAAGELERQCAGAPERLRDAQLAFRQKAGPFLTKSWIIERSITKPCGYPGDHELLDAFYTRRVSGGTVGGLLDALVLDCDAGRAVVDRKRHVARWLTERLAAQPNAKIVDLACGPCRLEKDLLDTGIGGAARFVAVDGDEQALAYANRLLGGTSRVELWHDNAIRIARDPGVSVCLADADYVVSLGLFDYLPDRIAARLLRALRRATRAGGELLVGNFAADNPSRIFMEWFGAWSLIHRSEREFLALFEEAGFATAELCVEREAEGGSVLLVTARCGGERSKVKGARSAVASA